MAGWFGVFIGGACCIIWRAFVFVFLRCVAHFQINNSIEQQNSLLPYSVNVFAGVILLLVAVPKIRNKLMPFFITTEEEIKDTGI